MIMDLKKLKERLQGGQTPAARSIGNKMPATGSLKTWRDKDGTLWIRVDNGPRRFESGLLEYNEDAKTLGNG